MIIYSGVTAVHADIMKYNITQTLYTHILYLYMYSILQCVTPTIINKKEILYIINEGKFQYMK